MKVLFIDRDGTLIEEPEDQQIDSFDKLQFLPGVIPALLELKAAGYNFVMVSNQDGLGSSSFPSELFWPVQDLIIKTFSSQGIKFQSVRICPHSPNENCECRKPKIGLLLDYLKQRKFEPNNSYVIGDRNTDVELAENLGITGIKIGSAQFPDWKTIASKILSQDRVAVITRTTNETRVDISINLDSYEPANINTGIAFFDHMLEQIAAHGGFSLTINTIGDIEIDDHHSVEDTALVLGKALKKALGDKRGIARYGFLLPMDESLAQIAIDLSGRPYCSFSGKFGRDRIGDFSTELVEHFFTTLAYSIEASIHLNVSGKNTHHMIEACFKSLGRCLRQAIKKIDLSIASTKGGL